MKKTILLGVLVVAMILFFSKQKKVEMSNNPKETVSLSKEEKLFLNLEKKTENKPSSNQRSVNSFGKEFKIVKFYYNKENFSLENENKSATEYKVFYNKRLVLRFNLFERKNGNKEFSVLKRVDSGDWEEKLNKALQ